MSGLLKLEGWKMKKVGDVGFLQCPYCGYCYEGIFINEDNTVKCYNCKRKFHKNKLKMITLKNQSLFVKSVEQKCL